MGGPATEPVRDEAAVSALAEETQSDVAPASQDDGRTCDVLVDGRDITWETRNRAVDANVSIVSAYPRVRSALSQQQRRIGLRGKVVMVGRDIGTVVLPDADLKIYLDATAEERAKRRCAEILARDGQIIATPTLVKQLPPPLRRVIGDLSSRDKVLLGLDVRPREDRAPAGEKPTGEKV